MEFKVVRGSNQAAHDAELARQVTEAVAQGWEVHTFCGAGNVPMVLLQRQVSSS